MNSRLILPALVARDVDADIAHGQQKRVEIRGDETRLRLIRWIIERTPDLLRCERQGDALIVCPA